MQGPGPLAACCCTFYGKEGYTCCFIRCSRRDSGQIGSYAREQIRIVVAKRGDALKGLLLVLPDACRQSELAYLQGWPALQNFVLLQDDVGCLGHRGGPDWPLRQIAGDKELFPGPETVSDDRCRGVIDLVTDFQQFPQGKLIFFQILRFLTMQLPEKGCFPVIEQGELLGDFFFLMIEDLGDFQHQSGLPEGVNDGVFFLLLIFYALGAKQRGDNLLRRVVTTLSWGRHGGHGQATQLGGIIVLAVFDIADQMEKPQSAVAKRAGSMCLTETVFNENIRVFGGCPVVLFRLDGLEDMDLGKEQKERVLAAGRNNGARKIQGIVSVHMQNIREKVTFYLSAVVYLLFNFRLGADVMGSLKATAWQILQTAPYVAGCAYVIIAMLQYMSGGEKVPWDRRLRLFFAMGILAGLVFAIWEYAGQGTVPIK